MGKTDRYYGSSYLSVWALALLLLCLPEVEAKVVKQLEITSVPSGAQVSLKRGTREIPMGKTPFTYEASFHSEQSVLRVVFRKKGYEDKIVKMKASNNKVMAKLKGLNFVSKPSAHQDPQLKALQKKLNPVIDKTLPRLLKKDGKFDYNLAGQATVKRMGGKIYLVVPILLRNLEGKFESKGKARRKRLVASAWGQLGPDLVVPLARELKGRQDLHGLVLDMNFDEQRFLFGVSSRVESRIEVECVPGYVMKNVFDACAKRRDAVCEGGMMMKSVYDPCARRMPVTKSQVVVDPKTGVAQGKAKARYILPLNGVSGKLVPYEKVSVVLQDKAGKTLFSQGEIPWQK
jgi:hypothetical protein